MARGQCYFIRDSNTVELNGYQTVSNGSSLKALEGNKELLRVLPILNFQMEEISFVFLRFVISPIYSPVLSELPAADQSS
jgi:hypothetical protein